jgi:hydrogenase expression/formation protein HypD
MKYIDEYRDREKAVAMAQALAAEVNPSRKYRLMEFCGGHTHAIYRHGILSLLPPEIEMVHGPGCPVCVMPLGRIVHAQTLAKLPRVILCTYGDMLRVPGADGKSLLSVKADGADIRMVASILDSIRIAQENPDKEVVFFAIGFETTTPPTAVGLKKAKSLGIKNFSVFCNHVLTPPAIQHILEAPEVRTLGTVAIDGFLGPAHVSTIIGSRPYEFFAEEFQKPVVISGFEPLDVIQSILMLVKQINEGRAEVENQFTRAVSAEGNEKAKSAVAEVFELRRAFEWRGLGEVPYSALKIKSEFAEWDAEVRFLLDVERVQEHKGCACGAILRGAKRPVDCPLFGKACTPEHPIGSCMVSSEGACAAYYQYGRFVEAVPD